MDLKPNFYTIFRTLNPYNHQELSGNKFLNVLKYYIFIILFSVIIMSLLFVPYIYSAKSYVERGVGHFGNLTVSSEFTLRDSFNILSDPVIKFDASEGNITNELVIITPDSINYKRYLIFGQYRSIPLNKGVDVVGSDRAQQLISLGFFFILPSLLFWAAIFSIVYFTIIILVTYLLVVIISTSLRINVSLLRLLKMCIYASTIFILLQLLLMPFFRLFIFPLVVYWILVIIILFLWQDSMFKNRRGQGEEREMFGSRESKGKDVFGDGGSYGGHESFKHDKIALRDQYNVDGYGNLKSSPNPAKKHRSFDDDNEGYVELK
jgi:hypothetical protein